MKKDRQQKTKTQISHGKVTKNAPGSLEKILGKSGLSKYGTLDCEEYEKKLSKMSKADLQLHAAKIGILPLDSSERLRISLVKEFKKYVSCYQQPLKATSKLKKGEALEDKAKKIMSYGK